MFRRRRYLTRGIVRRLIGLALLVCVCASFFPFPVALPPTSEKDQSAPFPCQNHSCGCASADQCWKQCCCFTNVQKIVWAQENGVTPPEYVAKAAREESDVRVAKRTTPLRENCALIFQLPSACGENSGCESSDRNTNCSRGEGCRDSQRSETETIEEESDRYVVGIEMLKCRGQGFSWNSLPWAVIPAVLTPEFHAAPIIWGRPQSVVVVPLVSEPPVPPPRLA